MTHHIEKPATHEIGRLRVRIRALEKQCEHDAVVKASLADRVAFLERELAETTDALDDAVRLGTQYAALGRAVAADHVALTE